MKKFIFIMITFFSVFLYANEEAEKIRESINVLDRFMAIPEESIPSEILSDAKAIAIIPHLIKAGFVVGGRYGKGILLVKDINGRWSDPLFITLAGGSIGWQIGAQAIDVVLVFKTKESVNGLIDGKITLGADASVAAGPLGRSTEAATDIKLKSEIYAYSKSKGFFVGVSLAGAVMKIDIEAVKRFYKNSSINPADVITGKVKSKEPLVKILENKIYEYSR